jgi:hypothetical protein
LADLLQGEKLDRRGNLVMEDTRSGMGFVSRVLGVKTTNEMQLSAAYQENAVAASQRVADFARIRRNMLEALRDGTMDEAALGDYMFDYLAKGGQESQWKAFVSYAAEMAEDTKAERALNKLIAKSGEVYGYREASVNRLLDAGAPVPE